MRTGAAAQIAQVRVWKSTANRGPAAIPLIAKGPEPDAFSEAHRGTTVTTRPGVDSNEGAGGPTVARKVPKIGTAPLAARAGPTFVKLSPPLLFISARTSIFARFQADGLDTSHKRSAAVRRA